jgi:hypothetical protein
MEDLVACMVDYMFACIFTVLVLFWLVLGGIMDCVSVFSFSCLRYWLVLENLGRLSALRVYVHNYNVCAVFVVPQNCGMHR